MKTLYHDDGTYVTKRAYNKLLKENKKLREALLMISVGIDPRTAKYRKEVKSVCSEAFKDMQSIYNYAASCINMHKGEI